MKFKNYGAWKKLTINVVDLKTTGTKFSVNTRVTDIFRPGV